MTDAEIKELADKNGFKGRQMKLIQIVLIILVGTALLLLFQHIIEPWMAKILCTELVRCG